MINLLKTVIYIVVATQLVACQKTQTTDSTQVVSASEKELLISVADVTDSQIGNMIAPFLDHRISVVEIKQQGQQGNLGFYCQETVQNNEAVNYLLSNKLYLINPSTLIAFQSRDYQGMFQVGFAHNNNTEKTIDSYQLSRQFNGMSNYMATYVKGDPNPVEDFPQEIFTLTLGESSQSPTIEYEKKCFINLFDSEEEFKLTVDNLTLPLTT